MPALQVLALSATFAPEAKLRVQKLMHEPLHVEVDVEETVSLLGLRQFYRMVGWQHKGTAAVQGQFSHQACEDVHSVTTVLSAQGDGEAGWCGCRALLVPSVGTTLCVSAQGRLCSRVQPLICWCVEGCKMTQLSAGACRQSSVQLCYVCCQGCGTAGHVFLCELHSGEPATAACCLPDDALRLAITVPASSLQHTASLKWLVLTGGVLVQTVVFCNSKLDAHWLAEYLTAQGYKAAFLSGDCLLFSHR